MSKLLKLTPCEAPAWARGGHAQTIVSFCLPSRDKMPGEIKILPLPDGDRLALLYTPGKSNYVIYLFHGLTGSASASYMERIAKICSENGHSVYRVNHRGCGEGAGLAEHPYHSGRGEDISEVIAFGRKENPGKQHIAIGFSLSGNALLTLLTGLRGSVLPDYAISVNAPIDLSAAVDQLRVGINKIYDLHFVQKLRQVVQQKCKIPRLSSVRNFDSLYTAPASGFKNAEHYYETCSTFHHLNKIKIPTILLTSQDDPFVPSGIYQKAKLSETTQLHIEKVGGHMGYLSRKKTPLGTHRWLDYAIVHCLQIFMKKDFKLDPNKISK